METPKPHIPTASGQKIPQVLIDQLGHANEEFHKAKRNLEGELDSFEPDREERVAQSRSELRDGEQQLEEVSRKIHESIEKSEDMPVSSTSSTSAT